MEGPSLFLAQEWLAPLIGQKIIKVEGNSKIGIERLKNQKIEDIFSWGKHLVFQFETFALRVHFMLFGSFAADVNGKKVTGDYESRGPIRLAFYCKKGTLRMYNCSLKYLESEEAKLSYDFTTDVMSERWEAKKAFKKARLLPNAFLEDLLLDQTVFSGVGNIIKNEALFIEKIAPETKVSELSDYKLKKLIKTTHDFCFRFYEWRKQFELKKHLLIYRKTECSTCHAKIKRIKTGKWSRFTFFCPICQKKAD